MQKDTKKLKKHKKRTQYMCKYMLIWLRKDINFRPVDMYQSLGIPRRTYQDYEAGHRGIPADVADSVRDIHRRNRQLMSNICHGTVLPSRTPGFNPSEWLRKVQQDEYEAGIIRVKGNVK